MVPLPLLPLTKAQLWAPFSHLVGRGRP